MVLQQLADTMEFEELYKRISPRLKGAVSFYNRRGSDGEALSPVFVQMERGGSKE